MYLDNTKGTSLEPHKRTEMTGCLCCDVPPCPAPQELPRQRSALASHSVMPEPAHTAEALAKALPMLARGLQSPQSQYHQSHTPCTFTADAHSLRTCTELRTDVRPTQPPSHSYLIFLAYLRLIAVLRSPMSA